MFTPLTTLIVCTLLTTADINVTAQAQSNKPVQVQQPSQPLHLSKGALRHTLNKARHDKKRQQQKIQDGKQAADKNGNRNSANRTANNQNSTQYEAGKSAAFSTIIDQNSLAQNSASSNNSGSVKPSSSHYNRKGKFSFEFAKAEILDIVKAISDMTRKNFIIPDALKSKRLTILSPTKITSAEAYQVFLTSLAANNITIIRSGKFYRLIASKAAIKTTIPTCIGPDEVCPQYSEQMVTVLVRLQYIEANQINPVIKSLISKSGEVTIFQPSNALIISEWAPNLTRIRRVIRELDQKGFQDDLQLVQIHHAAAQEIADKLTQIFDVKGGRTASMGKAPARRGNTAGKVSASDVQISKILSDERSNKIIIKANKRSFEAIKRMINQLDVPIGDEAGGIHVLYLKNASAEELASTLSSLAQSNPNNRRPNTPRPGNTQANRIADSADLFQGDVKVTAEKATNALIIVASSADFRTMERLIAKLDRPRPQVFVEAAILEVNVSTSEDIGLKWHAPAVFSAAKGDLPGGLGGMGIIQSAQDGGTSPTLLALDNPAALIGMAGGSIAGVLGSTVTLPGSDIQVPSFGVILKLLETTSTANILSTPHILTTDNEEASIEIGQRIPFQRGTSIPSGISSLASSAGLGGAAGGLGGLGNLFSSTDRIDVSLKLTITPQINEHGKVRLETDLNIEDVTGTEPRSGQPITANRSAKTTVVVDDQQTVILGGLMRDRVTESYSKIPLLGDLPLIGWLFKTYETKVEKVNLLLVLTPYIIHDSSDFQHIFEHKMAEYEEFAADYYGRKTRYQAHINYARKTGPLALLGARLKTELSRIENGGQGSSNELLIAPAMPETPVLQETKNDTDNSHTDNSHTDNSNAAEVIVSDKNSPSGNDNKIKGSPSHD